MSNSIVIALCETLHACEELVLSHEWIQPHGRGMVMRRADTWIIERVDVVDFPLRPVKMVWDRVQVVELLGYDRPGRVTVQFFGKSCDLLPITAFGLARIKSCSEMTWPSGVRTWASPSRNGALPVRVSMTLSRWEQCSTSRVHRAPYRPCNPDSRILHRGESVFRGTKRSAGVTVQQLQHSAVLVQAVIKNRRGSSAGSIDHVLLGILVKFFF